jgi:hypothetical protein
MGQTDVLLVAMGAFLLLFTFIFGVLFLRLHHLPEHIAQLRLSRNGDDGAPHQVQQLPAWIGGHGTQPYEQNTQQSPGNGFSLVPDFLQS